jgi:hypothetical protein
VATKQTSARARRSTRTSARTQTPRLLPPVPKLELENVANATLNGAAVDLRLVDAVEGLATTHTVDGPNLLTMLIEDGERDVLNSEAIESQIVLDLGLGRRWVFDPKGDIGGYSYSGTQLSLKFWDATSGGLRARAGYLSRSSKNLDLAGWANVLVRDALKGNLIDSLRVVIPDPGEVPQIITTTATTAKSAKKATGLGGSSTSLAKITVKHVRASAEQRKNIDTILRVAVDEKAPWIAAVAAIVAGTQESSLINTRTPSQDGYGSLGVWQITAANARRGMPQLDVAWGARHFLRTGFTGAGGAIELARKGIAPGRIAPMVEGPAQQYWPEYLRWESEAERTVKLWSGLTREEWNRTVARGKAAKGGTSTRTEQREISRPSVWTRGTAKKLESSWTALGRHAEKLGRRRFVDVLTPRPRLVLAADQQLILAQPHATYVYDDDAFLEPPNIDIEGAGHLQEITLRALASGWSAPPGGVVDLQRAGPASGPWLVKEIGQDAATSDEIAVTLMQPSTTVPDPETTEAKSKRKRSSTSRRSSSGSSASVVDRVYSAGHKMSSSGVRYGPSGHTGSWATAERAGSQDCSSSTSIVLHEADLMGGVSGPQVSDWFLKWGLPGRGKEMTVWVKPGSGDNGHVFVEFYGRTAKHFNTSQGYRGQGPRMRTSAPFTSGFIPRHAANT